MGSWHYLLGAPNLYLVDNLVYEALSVLDVFDLPAFDSQNIKRKILCDVNVMISWFPSKSNGSGKIIPWLMQTCL